MTTALRTRLHHWADVVNARTVRERALLFLTLMVVVYGFAVTVVFAPLQKEHSRLRQIVEDRSAEVAALNAQLQNDATRQSSEILARTVRLDELKTQLREIERSGAKLNKQLVPPKEMIRLVTQLLNGNPRLRWIEMESLKPTVMTESQAAELADGAVIYKHGMRVRFSGEYRDIVEYLRTLEALPWTLFWGDVALEVDQPPRSTVSVLIYTLSTQDTWIGG